ncbi:MAG TPA: hypothetical protein VL832_25410 [Puia sp.]|jgi:hypothetical protein|nr:hypothetical protein [Puia sp.]
MANTSQGPDILNFDEGRKKLPDMLNVLTILTFIGCGIGCISSVYSYFNAQKSYDDIVKLQDNLDSAPEFVKKLAGPKMVEIARNSLENRLPILLLAMVGYVLCLYGAIKMRAWKKEGFPVYVLGEILPVVAGFIFIGAGMFNGFAVIGALIFPAAFIIMYASQRKYLS